MRSLGLILLICVSVTGCKGNEESAVASDPCALPQVFGSCAVSNILCVSYSDGGFGSSDCSSTYSGTWGEGETCSSTDLTGRCFLSSDGDEATKYHYDENDTSNEAACSTASGTWCNN
jgi:hypothetical protein